MKDVLNKTGIYDFWSICGTGAISIIYYAITRIYIDDKSIVEAIEFISKNDSIMLIFVFLIFSYFVGLVCHEIGKTLTENRSELFDIVKLDDAIKIIKSPKKQNFLHKLSVSKKMCDKFILHTDDLKYKATMYDALSHLKNRDKTTITDRYHSIYGLCRGIWVGFLGQTILSLVSILMRCTQISFKQILVLLVNAVLSILFYRKTYRFYLAWAKNVFIQYDLCLKKEETTNA